MFRSPATSVLVIDDNTALTENLAEILEEFGAEVHQAENAEVALQQFDERDWSLVVTDLRMPGMDGIELLSMLKERSPGTPMLVMTGYADRKTIARALESGALAVVDKPLDLDAFLQLVGRVTAAEPTAAARRGQYLAVRREGYGLHRLAVAAENALFAELKPFGLGFLRSLPGRDAGIGAFARRLGRNIASACRAGSGFGSESRILRRWSLAG